MIFDGARERLRVWLRTQPSVSSAASPSVLIGYLWDQAMRSKHGGLRSVLCLFGHRWLYAGDLHHSPTTRNCERCHARQHFVIASGLGSDVLIGGWE